MSPIQYENIIDCLLELIHNQNRIINGLQLQEVRASKKLEPSKLKLFMQAFDTIADKDNDVGIINLSHVLEGAGFTDKEIAEYIKKALQNGQIYERKSGTYSRA